VITQRAKREGESTEFVGAGGLVWQYEYTLKDHLGNTRVTFADIDGSRTIDRSFGVFGSSFILPLVRGVRQLLYFTSDCQVRVAREHF
jgi:hypothetical protein